jgi:hypothetical protein
MLTYPIDYAATRKRWTLWDPLAANGAGAAIVRDRDWPNTAGTAIAYDPPHLLHLLQIQAPYSEYDSRLRAAVQPPRDVVDLDAQTIYRAYDTPLLPEAAIITAIRSEAEGRKVAAMESSGIRSPTDQTRALALLLAERGGQTLSAAQMAFLGDLRVTGLDSLDAIDATAETIVQWVLDHPGEEPDISEAVWPVIAP